MFANGRNKIEHFCFLKCDNFKENFTTTTKKYMLFNVFLDADKPN